MQISRVILKNYCQHEDLTIDLEPGINGIIGPNGSGKSTILDAIRFGITGISINPGNRADNITWGKNSGSVTILFSHGQVEYKIVRRLPKQQVLTGSDGTEMTRNSDIKEKFEDMLGTSVDSLLNNIFVGQGVVSSILFATDTPRLREIQRTVGLSKISEAEKVLANEIGKYSVSLDLTNQIEQTQIWLDDVAAELRALSEKDQQLTDEISEVEYSRDLLDQAEAAKRNTVSLRQLERRKDSLVKQKANAESELADKKTALQALQGSVEELQESADEASKTLARYEIELEKEGERRQVANELVKTEKALSQLPDPVSETELEELRQAQVTLRSRHDRLDAQALGKEPVPETDEMKKLSSVIGGLRKSLEANKAGRRKTDREHELINGIASRKKDIEVFKTGVCPTCEQPVSTDPGKLTEELASMEPELAELQGRLEAEWKEECVTLSDSLQSHTTSYESLLDSELKKVISKRDKTASRIEAVTQAIKDEEKLAKSIARLSAEKGRLEQRLSDLDTVAFDEQELEQLRDTVAKYNNVAAQVSSAESRITSLTETVDRVRNELSQLDDDLEEVSKGLKGPSASEVEKAAADFEILIERTQSRKQVRDELEPLRVRHDQLGISLAELRERAGKEEKTRNWVAMCTKARSILHVSKLPSLLMQQYAQVLNRHIHRYLSIWESSFTMYMDENLSFMAEKEEYEGHAAAAARLSGGEKVVGSSSYRLAMADTFARDVGLLILDEPSTHLDKDNLVHLQNLLLKLKDLTGVGGRQVIIVDHQESLMGFFDNIITLGVYRER